MGRVFRQLVLPPTLVRGLGNFSGLLSLLGERPRTLAVMCECSRPDCEAMVAIDRDEFDAATRRDEGFIVRPGHADADQQVVRRATTHWIVVPARARTGLQLAGSLRAS